MSGGVALLVGCHSEQLYSGPGDALSDLVDGVADAGVELPPVADVGPDGVADADAVDAVADAVADATPDAVAEVDAGPACDDPFAGGQLVAVVAFADEDPPEFHTKVNAGWDGRLYTDLSTLEQDGLIIPPGRHFIRTFEPDLINVSDGWTLTIDGLAQTPTTLTLDDLLPLVKPMGVHLLECSGNGRGAAFGLMSACSWDGVPLSEVLALAPPSADATQVLVVGHDAHSVPSTHSTPGASWVFSLQQLADAGAFIATHMDGAPLIGDHGAPARLLMPGWYGCTNIKWLQSMTYVDDTQPSTAQMKEFATRTHQVFPPPELAKDYQPASLDQTAMPVRVEQWEVSGQTVYRVIGVMWGGAEPTDKLQVRFGSGGWEDVDVCPAHSQNATWTLWTHAWTAPQPGRQAITLRINDPAIETTRLDSQYYLREVDVVG